MTAGPGQKNNMKRGLFVMIIDLILDRKDGVSYRPEKFYRDVLCYGYTAPDAVNDITRAMDYGTEKDVKNALCRYVIFGRYNGDICEYIKAVNWL